MNVVSNKVRVIVEGNHGSDRSGARAAIVAAGGVVEAENANLVQALVPASALSALAAQADVGFVRPPFASHATAIADEGVATTNANVWQADPIDGTGVRVGIVDLGFAGYPARQATGDLPSTLVTQDFCDGGFSTITDHGAAVAEIVHKMAPGAQLYLICICTEVQLGQAETYAKANNIRIINHSVGWFNTSRGDGTGVPGTPDAIVADARNNGILWVNAAGNSAQGHWSGTFSD